MISVFSFFLSSLNFKAICNDHFNSKLCNFGHVNSLVHYFLPRPYLTTLDFPSYFRDHSKLPWSKNSKWYHRLWMSLVQWLWTDGIPFPPPLNFEACKGCKRCQVVITHTQLKSALRARPGLAYEATPVDLTHKSHTLDPALKASRARPTLAIRLLVNDEPTLWNHVEMNQL